MAQETTIQFKRGLKQDLNPSTIQTGEPVFVKDTGEFGIGTDLGVQYMAGLDSDGKISNDVLPSEATTEHYTVSSISQQSTLDLQIGDTVSETSTGLTYYYTGEELVDINAMDGGTF